MKVWILSSEMPGPRSGGIARYAENMATALAIAGHEAWVIGPDAVAGMLTTEAGWKRVAFVPRDQAIAAPQPPVEEPDARADWPYNSLNRDLALAHQLADEVVALIQRHGAPDLIEVQEYKALGVFIQQRALLGEHPLAGIPVVVHCHTPDFIVREFNQEPRHKLPDYWVGQQERWSMLAADGLVAPSAWIARELRQRLGTPELAIEVCPLPADTHTRPRPGPGRAGELVAFGRLEPRKGALAFIEACARLWEAGEDFRLHWIGDAVPFPPKGVPLNVWLTKKFGPWIEAGRLKLSPGMPRAELVEHLAEAAWVVVPSLWENCPNTAIEALLLARPLLTSRQGGQVEILGDEPAALLFDWQREGDCERVLREALRLPPAARQALGERGRQRVRAFCEPQAIVRQRLAHYAAVRAAFRPRTRFPFVHAEARGPAPEIPAPPTPSVAGRISAIVPCYNLGAYVETAVDSILASDWPDLEVLVIDDGSTEPATHEALARLAARGEPRLRLERRANAGLARTRNHGARCASGAYLAFVDADDALGPDFLRRAAGVLDRYANVHVAYSWVRFFDAGRGIWPAWNWCLPYLLAHNLLIPLCLVRRDAFLAFGQNDPAMHYGLEDYGGWIGMALAGCGGVAIPEPLVRYRIRQNSMFQSINREQQLYLYDTLVRARPELYDRYGAELFLLQNANGPAHAWDQPTAWVAPYDALQDKLLEPWRAECKTSEKLWKEGLALRGELEQAHKNAEFHWRDACALREELEKARKNAETQWREACELRARLERG